MRTQDVVVLPPFFDDLPSFRKTREEVRVQALVAEAPVEAFDETVVRQFAGADELQFDPVFMRPAVQGFSGERPARYPFR